MAITTVIFVIGLIIICLAGVSCVRWSPSGDMIASVSSLGVGLLDFKTGKELYYSEIWLGGNINV